ncbi:MAG: hypothetical protein ACK4IY_02045, partial [Chitinophagales bacterium]
MKNYIGLLIATLFCLHLISCKNKETSPLPEPPLNASKNAVTASGKLVYNVKVVSPDTNDIKTFFNFNPSLIEMYFSGSTFRMIEHG